MTGFWRDRKSAKGFAARTVYETGPFEFGGKTAVTIDF